MRDGRVSGFSEGFLYLLKACLEIHRLGDISIHAGVEVNARGVTVGKGEHKAITLLLTWE
jgi:hypothetical protein